MARKPRVPLLPRDGVVVDLETTGLNPVSGARVIEIGAVRIHKGVFSEEFHSLINPGFALPEIAQQITQISDEELAQAPSCEEVLPKFLAFLGRGPIMAHNAVFEHAFLDSECQCIGLLPLVYQYHCTLKLSRKRIVGPLNFKLETLVRYLRLPVKEQFHRALPDARATAHLWRYLYELEQDTLDAPDSFTDEAYY